jgi:hypothetical protein
VVGLAGLLSQPEVADVVATLRVLSDLTANADLLRLLSGPRWRIGVRDLALLGERSAELVSRWSPTEGGKLDVALDAAVAGVDPTEVASLSDALADPGDKGYSDQARERFAALAAELRMLRRSAGDPLTDLVRKVVLTLGLDIELAAASGPGAQQAMDNLALLMETVADFATADPFASVHGLVAYLDAELEFNRGMGVAEPSDADSVKLLTAHSAKGLEWRGVLVPFMSAGVFPTAQARPRWQWSAKDVPWPLRGDRDGLPSLSDWTTAGMRDYAAACRAHAELEERRLAYVAVTRAKELLVASGHWWGRTQVRPRGPSAYLSELLEQVDPALDAAPWWGDAPEEGASNPAVDGVVAVSFPGALDEDLLQRRRVAAQAVSEAIAVHGAAPDPADAHAEDQDVTAAVLAETGIDLQALDVEIAQLVAEAEAARGGVVEVDLPPTLSATSVQRLRTDPDGFARDLARPLPRKPSTAARFGTRFHAWVQGHVGQQSFLDPTDLPGRADADIADEVELAELKQAFADGPFGSRVPHVVEWPFTMLLAGQTVAGRIDAVYQTPRGLRGGGLEDRPARGRRGPLAAGDLPPRLGRGSRAGAGPGRRGVPPRTQRPGGAASRPARPGRRRGGHRRAEWAVIASPADRERDLRELSAPRRRLVCVRSTARPALPPAPPRHLGEGLLPLRGRGLRTRTDVIRHRADRQRAPAVRSRQRVEGVGLHLDREHAMGREQVGDVGAGVVEGVRGQHWPTAGVSPRASAASWAARRSAKSAHAEKSTPWKRSRLAPESVEAATARTRSRSCSDSDSAPQEPTRLTCWTAYSANSSVA